MARVLIPLFAMLAVLGVLARDSAAAPPNVVMIVSDDQAWHDYGFLGHPTIATPRLDQLARESLVFTRGYVPDSLCRPSLMTMLSGLYPHQHKVVGNDPLKGVDRTVLLKHVQATPTLPKLLGSANYLSQQTGKWWEGHFSQGGFTHGMTHGDPKRGGRHGDVGLKIGREGLEPIYDFIRQRGERPFFLWYAPMMPHSPHTPPPEPLQKYAGRVDSPFVAKYYAMCEWFDQTCGELLDFLDREKLADNTLVVYVTDNGWLQNINNPQFAPKSKRSPYDGGVRTPIMFRWPGKIKPLRDDATLASSIDLAPSILAACGITAPAGLPGVNLLPVADGVRLERDTLFGEIFSHDIQDIDQPAASLLYRWCIAGEWKLIAPAAGEASELYHLTRDPREETNLAEREPSRVAELTGKLNAWWNPSRN